MASGNGSSCDGNAKESRADVQVGGAFKVTLKIRSLKESFSPSLLAFDDFTYSQECTKNDCPVDCLWADWSRLGHMREISDLCRAIGSSSQHV